MTTKGRRRGKDLEKYVAEYFGGDRRGILGGDDVRLKNFSVECKSRQRLPVTIKKWFTQAEDNAKFRIPIVYLHETNESHAQDLVIIRAIDIRDFIMMIENPIYTRHQAHCEEKDHSH